MHDRYADLQVQLTEIDQSIHDFAKNFPDAFSLHLDFPYASQQQSTAMQAGGFEKETYSQTTQAIFCLKHLEGSDNDKYLQQLANLLPKLSENINHFLNALQLAKADQLLTEIERTCHDVVYQLNFITKNNQLGEQHRPKPGK